jgi:hypothetical protein
LAKHVSQHRTILNIGALVFLLIVLEYAVNLYSDWNNINVGRCVQSFSLTTIAIVSFFGFMWYMQTLGGEWSLNKAGMRLAIVVSVVTVYLVAVGTTMFYTQSPNVPEITRTLLTNFTAVVVAVVTFYFGASAYVQVSQPRDNAANEEQETNQHNVPDVLPAQPLDPPALRNRRD